MSDNIRAFKGLRYNFAAAGDSKKLLAPPYDVIPPEMQNSLYDISEHNIVRLILGKKFETDDDSNNRYTRSGKTLAEWIEKAVLKRDEQEAIYVYAQTYNVGTESKTRVGFIARKKLEDFGGSIIPHEKTLSGPKTDRLNLTRACKCNFSQIFGIFTDESKKSDQLLATAVEGNPEVDVTTDDGIRHRLWLVTDQQWIASLGDVISNKNIIIADGHHRYETALNYMKENPDGGEDVKYVMMYLTNTESEGLSILPTNRLIFNLTDFNLSSFLTSLEDEFSVEKIASSGNGRDEAAEETLKQKMQSSDASIFGLYSGNGTYHTLTYKGADSDNPMDKLDVGILHSKILDAKLGIGAEQLAAQSNVKYSQEIAPTAKKVDGGDFQLAFFLNPTPVEHMKAVTDAGLKMPQKSTYFYPKLISGLVINPLYS